MTIDEINNITEPDNENPELESGELRGTIHLSSMYKNWFLDYASYVILERAVPEVMDGLKPVQRRILHAMKELDDGRYNKVANIIGHTMKYHPHGDASIGDALVQLGQKELLIDTQGNWGNVLTGDSAAAARYIEARLSKFALEVLFNPKTTVWKASYDGRNKEPVALPVKFPLLLAQGVEGIAVGLASKILPHNFIELIDASVNILQGKEFEIYPDFLTGGFVDVSKYNDGIRSGKIRLRARMSQVDKKNLVITEIPYGTTTSSIIDSILAANEKGKIKIKKIDDNTSQNVEILIQLMPGVSPDTTMDALYAFTDCEVSISPNACVVEKGKPSFMGVSEILRICTASTLELLRCELEIRREELKEQLHFASLEKIFIEKEIYEGIKKCKTTEEIDKAILKGFKPFSSLLIRPIIEDDLHRLRKIPIERISRFNSDKADETIRDIQTNIEEVENHLAHLVDYAIEYFRQIKKKYGKGRERRSEIRNFDTIEAVKVAAATQRLYVNREEGFAGTSLRKDEFVSECSDIDELIAFRQNGTFIVTKVSDKVFVGQEIIHIAVFNKNDERTVYNLIYRDGKNGKIMVKRFNVLGVTRDKEYFVTKGTPDSKVLYFTANPNGEAEIIRVDLKPKPRLKKLNFDFDFTEVAIKGRGAMGNILTKYGIRKIEKRQEGVSTLSSRQIWYDDTVKRLNTEDRGIPLGDFSGPDRILTIMQSGHYRLTSFDLSSHFDEDMIHIEKYDPEKIYTAIYEDTKTKFFYVKRFQVESTERKMDFVGEEEKNRLVLLSCDKYPKLQVLFDMKQKTKGAEKEEILVHEFIGVKGFKAKGKRITVHPVKKVELLEPLVVEEPIVVDFTEIGGLKTEDGELMMEEGVQMPETEDDVSGTFDEIVVDLTKKTKKKAKQPKTEKEETAKVVVWEDVKKEKKEKEEKEEKIRPKVKSKEKEKEEEKEKPKEKGKGDQKPAKKGGDKKTDEPGDAVQMELPL
ncbi:MAG: DNA gyrase/topoisomerase IV subunit A [Bacteroidetes bacterium]|nr:DNA gyrase/topoisomerase IV subunit A [Bacteroidota bacterium]